MNKSMRRSLTWVWIQVCCLSSCILADGFTGGAGIARSSGGGISRGGGAAIGRSAAAIGYGGNFGGGNIANPYVGAQTRPMNGLGGAGQLGYPSQMTGGMKPTRPSQRPNDVWNPNVNTRPSPNVAQRPQMPGFGNGNAWTNNGPAVYPGMSRPSTSIGSSFGNGNNRPGSGTWPSRPTTRPIPPLDRPIGYPPNDRPINVNQIVINNYYFNGSLGWVNIGFNQYTSFNTLWQNQIYGLNNWTTLYPARVTYWNTWGNSVLHRWRWYPYHQVWFTGDWWYAHHSGLCQWHYYYQFNRYPWTYWWTYPTWNYVGTWFQWNAPANVWATPVYYDYGNGGNVVFRNNNVFINNQQIASLSDYSQTAGLLATVDPSQFDLNAQQAEWMPLGTFAMSSSERDTEPNRVIQLAVDRNGIVAGTLYNIRDDSAQAIQGRVDPQTQRVAFRFSGSKTAVAETGLYNLTQQSAPMLIHYSGRRVERYNLVRLEQQ